MITRLNKKGKAYVKKFKEMDTPIAFLSFKVSNLNSPYNINLAY